MADLFRKHAARYHKHGFTVMPIKKISKKAFILWKKFQKRRPTKQELNSWMKDYPDFNIAIITGNAAGLVVVDADSERGMNLVKEIGLPKGTPTVLTNRGEHYYFRYPDYDVPSRSFKELGLDIKSDGGYVLAPPSKHPDGGTYKWKVNLVAELPELPKKLMKLIENTLKQKADSDPFIKEPGMEVVDLAGDQVTDLPPEIQKWLETPTPKDRSGHDFKLCMLGLENGIFSRKALTQIILSNEHGKANSRKDKKKYTTELIAKAIGKFDAQLRYHSARKLARMEFPSAHEIIGKGVLLPGTGGIIAGEGGVGKSLLTSEMALRLRTCQAFIGIPTAKIESVLVIQGEIRLEMVRERLASQVKGLGLKKSSRRIYFTDPRDSYDLMNPKDLAKILRLVMKTKAEVVVIDPLSSYHHADENNNSEMRRFLSAIDKIKRTTGAAVVLVHHFSKSADRKGKHRLRGASSIYDWADTVIELSAGSPANMLKAKFLKSRYGNLLPDIYLKRDDNFVHQVVEDKAKCPPEKVREVLENEFNGQCNRQKDLVDKICQEIECSEKTARAGVKLAVKRGVIKEAKTDGKSKGYQIGKG